MTKKDYSSEAPPFKLNKEPQVNLPLKKVVAPFLRTPFNYDTEEASDQSGLDCKDKSLAQQHLAEETDINNIVATFTRTGQLPQHSLPPLQEDFSHGITSFQDAMDLVVAARESFQSMPAEVRNRFQNDPARFVDFCSNPKNAREMQQMGLYSPEAAARIDAELKETQTLIEEGKNARSAKTAPPAPQGDTNKKGVT